MFARLSVLFLLSFSVIFAAPKSADIQFKVEDSIVARYVSLITSHSHFSKKEIDNKLSGQFFDLLIDNYDSNKRIFLKEDIQDFARYKFLLDDFLVQGDLTFAKRVHTQYLKRLEERVEFVKERINEPFDFDKKEDFEYERKEKDWAKDRLELDEYWRKAIKNELLMAQYDKVKQEKKNKEKSEDAKAEETAEKKEGKSAPAPKLKTPEEKILKRYSDLLKYQKELEREELLELFLGTMTRCFDPHSVYFGPATMEEFRISMNLKLIGIGAQLQSVDGYTKVTRILKGGPAERDKRLEPGDYIYSVGQADEEPIDIVDMNLKKVVNNIRGKKGTVVKLFVMKGGLGGQRVVIDLVRDEVQLEDQAVKGEIKEVERNGEKVKVGVVAVPSFYADFNGIRNGDKGARSVSEDVKKYVEKFKEEGIKALVVDLRDNGGGSLSEAIRLTGFFIEKGPVVQVKDTEGSVEVQKDRDSSVLYDGPLVVMTNSNSASASEIFAAAIQDYGRGIVVGTKKTHGKGTVQQVYPLASYPVFSKLKDYDPGQIKLTIAKFYRINGGSTQNKGVVPDIVFPSYSEFSHKGESEYKHAMEWDKIASVDYKTKTLKTVLDKLLPLSKERLAKNELYKKLIDDISLFKEELERKKVALNKEERFTAFKEKELSGEKRKELLKEIWGDRAKQKEKGINDDFFLKEALEIASDYLVYYK